MEIQKRYVHRCAAAAITASLFLPALSFADAVADAKRRAELSNKGKAQLTLLWSIGGDIGQRVSDWELLRLLTAIKRTLCN